MNARSSQAGIARWLLSLLTPFTRQAAVSVLCGFAASASSVGLLATAAYLISAASLRPSVAELQVAIVAVRFFGLSRGAFRYLERLATHSVNFRLLASLRVWLYNRLEPLAPAGLLDERSGLVLGRAMGGLDLLENFYVRVAAPPLVAILSTIVVGIWLAGYQPILAMIWIVGALLLGAGLPLFLLRISKQPSRQLVQARSKLQAWLVDHLQGLPDLVSFNQAGASVTTASILQKEYDEAQKRLASLQGLEGALSTLIVSLVGVALLAAAIPLVNQGQLDRLLMAAIVIGGMAAFESLLAMPAAGRLLEESLAEASQLHELASKTPPAAEPTLPASLPAGSHGKLDLIIKNLSFTYPGSSVPALDKFSFQLPAGRRAALLGGSGAGKTTLVNLLLRIYDYPCGSILMNEAELSTLGSSTVRQAISCLPAKPHIFNTTLRQNLKMAAPDGSDEMIWQALRSAALDEFAASLPQGLDTRLGESGARLSAGECQRVALARFLLQHGGIWVLDEPTAHLDAITARQVRRNILQAVGGRSLLWITHDLAGLDEMDWIYILRNGMLVEQGDPASLAQAGGHYARLLALHQDITNS